MVNKRNKSSYSIANQRLSTILEKVKAGSLDKNLSFYRFKKDEILRRLLQIFLRDHRAQLLTELDSGQIDIDRLVINIADELRTATSEKIGIKLRVNPSHAIKQFILFFVYHFYILFHFLKAIFQGDKRLSGKKAVVMDHLFLEGFSKESEAHPRFVEFCEKGLITFLNDRPFIVQRSDHEAIYIEDQVAYVRGRPALGLLSFQKLTRADFVLFLGLWIKCAFEYVSLVFKFPLSLLMNKDISFLPLIQFLDQKNLISDYVITNSNYYDQEIWLNSTEERNFISHMIWYSANNEMYRFREETQFHDAPENDLLAIDIHWVWNQYQKEWFENTKGQYQKINIVGPIMWYLPKFKNISSHKRQVLIFDIVPVRDDIFNKVHGEKRYYYNRGETVCSFLRDTLEVIETLDKSVEIILKTKRQFRDDIHDPLYVKLVQGLVADKRLKIMEFGTNLFDEVQSSLAIIVMPNSSPAFIGPHFGIPSFYFDPTGELDSSPWRMDNPKCVHSKEELLIQLQFIFLKEENPCMVN